MKILPFSLRRYEWIWGIIATICIFISIMLFATFPPIYKAMVKKNLKFHQYEDGSLSYSAFMLTKPPMYNIMNFYMFNVTNPDEIIYEGAKPRLQEIGPFAIQESEQKKYYRMNANQTEMYYENYKMYNIREDLSCKTCNFDENLLFPNPTGVGATASMWDPKFKITKVGRTIIAIALTLMGETPFVHHTIKEVLFTGYNDALISAAHSSLLYDISGYFKGNASIVPIPIPSMPVFAYFQGYNNSKDEYYWIKTGKENIDELGTVVSWGGRKELPEHWWTTKQARMINGSDSGSFCKMHLDENVEIPMFQSFQCRSFTATYAGQTNVAGIPSYTFTVKEDQYDTTLEKNKGFRYVNTEHRNYFSEWPSCPEKLNCKWPTDCTVKENLCCNTCNGSYVNGNYMLPPGMFPLVCYPGKLEDTPFAVFYSPPHYLYSPPEVVNSVVGLRSDPTRHVPMIYNHEPYSGTVTEVFVRLQVNMPVIKSVEVPSYMHMPNKVIPLFWEDAHATLAETTYSKLKLGFVLVPMIITIMEFSLLGIGILIFTILVLIRICQRQKLRSKPANLANTNNTNLAQNGAVAS